MQDKIVHINHNISESSVPLRLMEALRTIGVESEIITMLSKVNAEGINVVDQSIAFKLKRKMYLSWIKLTQKGENISAMPFSRAGVGMNLLKDARVSSADIIVLHWIWGNFVSLDEIRKMLISGKKIVIVCHDNAHFTGGCHVRMGCDRYMNGCGACPQLNSSDENDITHKQLQKKLKIYSDAEFAVVSPSTWMDKNVAGSLVFRNKPHYVIPNPINTEFFCPRHEQSGTGVKRILFGAVNATSTPYKGYKELLDALSIFSKKYQHMGKFEAYVFGASGEKSTYEEAFSITYLGYLSQKEMVDAYSNADVYVVPSLEDSFNSTVAESLSCETPVVAFATGGIVDIIDHKVNGYLARYQSSEDLADGIFWVLDNNKDNVLGREGRKKVLSHFAYSVVGQKYKELFDSLE